MLNKILKSLKNFVRYSLYILARIIIFFVKFIPYDFCINLGGFLGFLYFKISKDRKDVINNLKIAFPDKTIDEILKIKKDFSIHIGKTFMEALKIFNNQFDFNRCKIIGKEKLIKALEEKKGVLLLTGHLGNWELLAAFIARLKLSALNVIAKKVYFDKFNDLLVNIRKVNNVKTLLRSISTKEMIKALKNNEFLGILIDQDTDVKSIFVEFFGKLCKTPVGLTNLAMHYKSPVVPIFISRIENNNHIINVEDPVQLSFSDNIENNIIENTKKFNEIIENRIKLYPAQWVWMHKRWKHRP